MEYDPATKKNETMPFAATWMDLEIIILSKVGQIEKDKYHIISLLYYVESKIWYKWTYLWNRNRLTDIKNKFTVTKALGRNKLVVWD